MEVIALAILSAVVSLIFLFLLRRLFISLETSSNKGSDDDSVIVVIANEKTVDSDTYSTNGQPGEIYWRSTLLNDFADSDECALGGVLPKYSKIERDKVVPLDTLIVINNNPDLSRFFSS
jgi:hypothetical protein